MKIMNFRGVRMKLISYLKLLILKKLYLAILDTHEDILHDEKIESRRSLN